MGSPTTTPARSADVTQPPTYSDRSARQLADLPYATSRRATSRPVPCLSSCGPVQSVPGCTDALVASCVFCRCAPVSRDRRVPSWPSIAPHGRTVWSKRTPSATGRSHVHSCYGEGGGDDCCAHKEYAHQADNTVAKAISAADIISNPRSGETRVQAPLSLIACVSSRRYGCIMCSHGVGRKGIAWSGGAPTWATRKTDVHQ